MKFSKLIVVIVVVLNVAFTAAALFVFYHTSSEPTGLITGWFSFTTGELWMLSGIKKNEMKEENKTNETI